MTDAAPLILVINLDRSTERLASATVAFGAFNLPFRRLSAVDAAALTSEQIDKAYDADNNRRHYFAPLHVGEIACFMSHRLAWRELLASDAPFAAVFEDDAVPSVRLPGVLDGLMRRSSGWDIVKLHGSSSEAAVSLGPIAEGTDLVRPWLVSLSGAAYCVTRAGAGKLLRGTVPFYRPLDVALQHWWEHGLELLAVRPDAAAVAEFATGSTVKSHRERRWDERLGREIRRPLFRARLALRSAWEWARY